MAKSIKRSASDRLGDLVPQVRARTFPGFFFSRHGASGPLSEIMNVCRSVHALTFLITTTVHSGKKFPKLWTSVEHSFLQQIAQNKN